MSFQSVCWVNKEESNRRALPSVVLRSDFSTTGLWLGQSPGFCWRAESGPKMCLHFEGGRGEGLRRQSGGLVGLPALEGSQPGLLAGREAGQPAGGGTQTREAIVIAAESDATVFCFQYKQIQFTATQMSIHSGLFFVKEEESNPHAFAIPVLRSELSSTALWPGQSPGASPRESPGEQCPGKPQAGGRAGREAGRPAIRPAGPPGRPPGRPAAELAGSPIQDVQKVQSRQNLLWPKFLAIRGSR